MLIDDIKEFVAGLPATLKEKRGIYSITIVVAERRVLLSKKKLIYSAKFRIDDANNRLRFTEMLKESGSGMSTGDDGIGPGFGFKKESYRTSAGARRSTITERSKMFEKKYNYTFDFSKVRGEIERLATDSGYTFNYLITSRGL